jgi:calcium-dependent phosphoinositide phospholipase C
MYPRIRTLATASAAVLALICSVSLQPGTATALDDGSLSLAGATSVGVHNTYQKSAYTYLDQALDAGSTLIELDAWANVLNGKWDVSHSDPLASDNNCVQANTIADVYTGDRSQNLDSCLDDIRIWLQAHPTANPIMVKIEMKNGFDDTLGMDPGELDSYVAAHLGNLVYKPVDLLTKSDGTQYPDLDTAAKAGNWPSRSALQGKAIVEIIPGTFEMAVSASSTWVDVVYAAHLKALEAAGTIASAEVFPSVLNAQAGDPRTRYSDTTLRPWFVVFDGDAGTYVSDGNTEWYNTNHYLVVATDAYDVSPALSSTDPALADAQARIALLASDSVSFVSTDWTTSPADGVLSDVQPRG